MKIAAFNVNGISARLSALLRWLAESKPDVACLQELKASQEKFPEAAFREAGYGVMAWAEKLEWCRTPSRETRSLSRVGAACPVSQRTYTVAILKRWSMACG
jgi:hypothetical protein